MSEPKSAKKDTSKSKDKTKEKEKEKEKDKKTDKSAIKDKEKDKKKKDKEVSISEVASIRGGDLKAPGKLELAEIQSKVDDFMSAVNTPFNKQEKSCIHHQQKMIYFCDSCQEPACQRCTVIGPHNSQLHRLQDIEVAFQGQSRALQSIINNSLITKRDQLSAQVYRIEYRVSEIKHVKTYIERDIRAEYEGTLEKLRAAEGTKTVVLRHDLENIQRDVDRINEILEVYTENTKAGSDHLDFLSKYSNMKDSVQYAMSKDYKKTIDVIAGDLPNDLPKKRAIIEKANHFERVSAFKDKVILELATRSAEQVNEIREEFDKRTNEEIQEWSKLTDTFNQELKKFQVICFYCGCDLTDTTINTVCKANKKSSYPINFGYTLESPEIDWHKTKRHFFAKPKPDIAHKGPSKDPEDEALSRSPLRDREARVPYQAFLEVIIHKILRGCHEENTTVEKILRSYDASHTGKISFTALAFLLNQHCALDNVETERLREVLDPLNKNVVQIVDFLQVVDDIQNYDQA